MNVRTAIASLRRSIPNEVKMVAVSKFHPVAMIQEAYDEGQRLFGESRVQELLSKQQQLPADIEWHFVGGLQRNKVKQIAPFVALIHSLDSERLMLEIEKQGAACERVIPCLLQVHIAAEETKAGFSPDECLLFLKGGRWRECTHLQIKGVMGMATYTDDSDQVRQEFRQLKSLFDSCKTQFFPDDPSFRDISMGMSDDYSIAIEEGSSMVRLGSLIFGDQ